jgi:phosphoribosylformylglycinamidine (FGAM) synthase PurS component
MKFRVFVSLKPTVLIPRADHLPGAERHGAQLDRRRAARQVFRHHARGGVSREQAEREIEQIAQDVLANPVIEDYRVEPLG